MAADRRVYRRLAPAHVILAIVIVTGAIAIATVGHQPVPGVVFGLDLLTVVYFVGPAATLVVTATTVLVNNVFVRHSIPRQYVQGVAEDQGSAALQVAGRTYRTSVFNDVIFYKSTGTRPTRRKVGWIIRAMEEVPEAPPCQGRPMSSLRYGQLLLAAFAVLIVPALMACAGLRNQS